MTFTEYLHTQPVLCGICIIIILLIVAIIAYEAIWNPGKHKQNKKTDKQELPSLSWLTVVLTILLLFGAISGIANYRIEQKAINDNYTVYIDGERSFTTSSKATLLDNKRLYSYIYVNKTNGWILCESKHEDKATVRYFNKYNKKVPKQ